MGAIQERRRIDADTTAEYGKFMGSRLGSERTERAAAADTECGESGSQGSFATAAESRRFDLKSTDGMKIPGPLPGLSVDWDMKDKWLEKNSTRRMLRFMNSLRKLQQVPEPLGRANFTGEELREANKIIVDDY
ncbi:uncharacterized protein PADG_00659 [Paracoccidioides brasiliensis Pb18]|uniref:Uncharacterized protein n=1 Tax=Paracoccidioides brasiliensis (strain Pb18) TaxID=502780 RepID=C1G1B9_PARBD|nr:uncharacterized protein PADG_00659 [Paracoccidioides brasiliensis Pb18]EEH44370.2 hypothetical protein PADG_00659 [Paracoccidioides brasiliensis Pb18]ODH53537.1 hypothetical protein GX48_00370 [Paracoccidioides brasiliensis]